MKLQAFKSPRVIVITSLLLITLLALGLFNVFTQPSRTHAASFPSRFFAPYVDATVYPTLSLVKTSNATGIRYYTLAFFTDNGSCIASWGGVTPVSQKFMLTDITNLRSQGGDVIFSFGGANGTELAGSSACTSVGAVQAQYQAVINTYGATYLDFDVEGGAVTDAASIDKRDKALAALQSANPGLKISFTLPVMPSGLTQDGINVLKNAVSNGVNINVVNVMAMDYGSSVPANQMGTNATQAATSLFNQLKSIYPSKSSAQIWGMIGVTPMIGLNDGGVEVFTEQDAHTLLTFAQQNSIAELAMWSEGRDQPCANNAATVGPTCSGITQNPYDFSKIFNVYTSNGPIPTATPTPPTGCPAPAWDSTAIYTQGNQVFYNGHKWLANWWTQGDVPGGNTNPGVWTDQGPCGNSGPTNTPAAATSTPKPVATNTPKPVATSTPKPVATNTPKPGSTSTPKPVATNTPKPGSTSTPKPVATSTPPSGAAPWTTGVAYSVGTLVTYGGHTYKCLQTHTSQVGWEPPNVPALWQLIS